jgi:DNA-binding transcriptional ArsR family regulator
MNNSKLPVSKPDVNSLLSRFTISKQIGNHYQAKCPAHDDKHASLSITLTDNNALIFCHAGCNTADVLKAAGLTYSDLFFNEQAPSAVYQYRRADGTFEHEKLKYKTVDGKTFKQRRIDSNGNIVYNLESGRELIPYNLPGLIKAIEQDRQIIDTEGEKDADTAELLGYPGTTTGGASDWKAKQAVYFKGASLAIFADSDKAGIEHAKRKEKDLKTVCRSLKAVILPPGYKDLTEYVEGGHNRQDVQALIDAAPELVDKTSKPVKFSWRDNAIAHNELITKQYKPLDFIIDDLLVSAGTGVLAGRKKIYKSFMALQLSLAVASCGYFLGHNVSMPGPVVHMALEDGERRTQARLKMQNAPNDLDITYFYAWPYMNTNDGFNQFRNMLTELRPRFVVIDTLAKVLNGKADQNSAGEMADFANRIHDLSLEMDCFILFVAHHGKASQMATSRDAGFDIRGSSAIPGATDVNIGLYRNDDKTFDFMVEGRDIEELELRIKFDKEITWAWQFEGEAQDVRRSAAEQQILDAMASLGGKDLDASQIADETSTSRPNVTIHLKRMRDYEKPLIKYEIVGKKILYSLTSFTTLTDKHYLQHLQDNIPVSNCKRTVSENIHA